jgi:RNA polymerase sigma factor (TIGR02999 family)
VGSPGVEEVTGWLLAWSAGDRTALDRLVPVVYQELRRLAAREMRRERSGHSLQTTALVNEAYLRLVDYRNLRPRDRSHFLAIAAQAMRRLLIDRARARRAVKRSSGTSSQPLEEPPDPASKRGSELVALDDALRALAAVDSRKERVVELKYFGGLTNEEAAEALDVSVATVKRDWNEARLWLRREMSSPAKKRAERVPATLLP